MIHCCHINCLYKKLVVLLKDLLEEAQEQSNHTRRSLGTHNLSLSDPEPASVIIDIQLKEKEELIAKLQNQITKLTGAFTEEIKQKVKHFWIFSV